MDFTELYAQKKMTADQAAALVKSGDWVDYGWAVNTPVAVDAAIAKRLPELEDVNFRGGILMWAVMSQSVVEPEIPQQTEPIEPPTETAEQPVEQSAPEKCPHCGSELKSGAKFCSVCGNKV